MKKIVYVIKQYWWIAGLAPFIVDVLRYGHFFVWEALLAIICIYLKIKHKI